MASNGGNCTNWYVDCTNRGTYGSDRLDCGFDKPIYEKKFFILLVLDVFKRRNSE